MSKVLVYLGARMGSSRCPNKAAYDLGGKPAFIQILERVQQFVPDADYYFVATTVEPPDDPLAFLAKQYGYDVFRHTVDPSCNRAIALFDYLGLKPDDVNIPVTGASPFVVCNHLPFSRKVLEETGLSTFPIARDGTILEAMYPNLVRSVGHYRGHVLMTQQGGTWKETGMTCSFRHLPNAFIEFPAEYQQLWPWNHLILDWPAQVLQIKGIYDILYKGTPIDIFDLPALFEERPHLAHAADPDAPTNATGLFPYGTHGRIIQESLNVTDSIIVKWDGKEGL